MVNLKLRLRLEVLTLCAAIHLKDETTNKLIFLLRTTMTNLFTFVGPVYANLRAIPRYYGREGLMSSEGDKQCFEIVIGVDPSDQVTNVQLDPQSLEYYGLSDYSRNGRLLIDAYLVDCTIIVERAPKAGPPALYHVGKKGWKLIEINQLPVTDKEKHYTWRLTTRFPAHFNEFSYSILVEPSTSGIDVRIRFTVFSDLASSRKVVRRPRDSS